MHISRHASGKKRILLVNASFDSFRTYEPRQLFLTAATATFYLAGAFNPDLCELRVHCEVQHGLLKREADFAWADMLVLTGTSNALDRMRQLTAYARTRNPAVIVVAGGPTVRALPTLAHACFDYACEGDLEEIEDVITDAWGRDYVKPGLVPRFDLYKRIDGVGFVETSRNCNFACSFCSLSGEGRGYQTYSEDFIRAQFESLGKCTYVSLQDNNFYGNDRASFRDRLAIVKEYWQRGYFKGWLALVTADFFAKEENLRLVREAGCVGLFSGVESLQSDMIERYSKKQNRAGDRFDIARKCIDHGMVFDYGLIFDAAHQTIDSFRADINDILSRDDVTSPGFLSLAIPLPGTPLFHEIAAEGGFLPNVRLRDMDGDTLVVWPKDPLDEVAAYVRTMSCMREHRAQLFRQVFRFAWNRRNDLSWDQLAVSVVKPLYRAFYDTSPFDLLRRRNPGRSAVATTEPLDKLYTPLFPVDSRHAPLFEPVMVTDRKGEVIQDDLRQRRRGAPASSLWANRNASPANDVLELAVGD